MDDEESLGGNGIAPKDVIAVGHSLHYFLFNKNSKRAILSMILI